MVINLITFASFLHKQTAVRNTHEVLLNELEKYFTVNLIDYQHIDRLSPDDFSVLFIATGGVECKVIQLFEHLPRPTLLLADGAQNSLASALEISAWLRKRGMKSEILHGELREIIKRLFILHSNFKAQRQLAGQRIGVMGTPAPWLVASNVDYLLAKRRWGVEYTDISLERVCELYERISDEEVGESCADLAGRALACREASPEDLLRAMRLYRAVKQVATEERLNALTLNCSLLEKQTKATGCLALSLLNDEGIVAGCEGDLQSIFTMLTVKILLGKASFMANPSKINVRTNEVVLSHCTIGLNQTEKFIIRNHFETDSSIGIQGIVPTGDVTLVKCGGECLDEYYLSTGSLTENTNYINMCRTQIRVHLDTPVSYFLKTPLGNHHIVLQGNYKSVLEEFMQVNGCKAY